MDIALQKAGLEDAEDIHAMQVAAFKPLLELYRDYGTNPGAEGVDRVLARLRQPATDFYIITCAGVAAGAIRIVRLDGGARCRISPIFVLPEYQNMGIASTVLERVEKLYSPSEGWVLDTILEEKRNCHLYEKLGYSKTGKVERIRDGMHLVEYGKPSCLL